MIFVEFGGAHFSAVSALISVETKIANFAKNVRNLAKHSCATFSKEMRMLREYLLHHSPGQPEALPEVHKHA